MKNKHYNKPTRSASIMKLEHIIVTVAVVSLLVGIPAGIMFSGKAKTLESQILQRKELERSIEQVNQELDAKSHDVNSKVEDIQRLEREKQELEAKLQARLQSKREVVVARAQAEAQVAVKTPPVAVSGGKTDWLRQAGIPESQWQYVDYIISKESGWRPTAVNKSSGACSLVQALPCSKIGANWADPVVALRWGNSYVKARYGGWQGAYQFWLKHKWY